MILSIFTLVPSPIFFGYLMDRNCLVWGKTCLGLGNCWLYNSETLRYVFLFGFSPRSWDLVSHAYFSAALRRYSLNTIAASCVFFSVLFDLAIWYYAKDLKMYDEEPTPEASASGGRAKETEMIDLVADAEVMMQYKSAHRGSDVCT